MHPGPQSPPQTLSTLPAHFDVAAKTITEHAVTKRTKMRSMPNKTLADESSLTGKNETPMTDIHRQTNTIVLLMTDTLPQPHPH